MSDPLYDEAKRLLADRDTWLLNAAPALVAEVRRLRGVVAERERPPPAPDRCPGCLWSNTGLINYGINGATRWLCHGCAARALSGATP